jgi:hypothetical protein
VLLYREIDYRNEASNMLRFAKQLGDAPWCYVPRVVPSLCTKRVLVQECVRGVRARAGGGWSLTYTSRPTGVVVFSTPRAGRRRRTKRDVRRTPKDAGGERSAMTCVARPQVRARTQDLGL